MFWDPAPADNMRQTKWRTAASAFARDGFQVVVVGPAPESWHIAVPLIAGPPHPDAVPDALMTDADPVSTLARYGVNGSGVLVADAAVHGLPEHFGHALQRLRALAWTARWMDHWLSALQPDVIVMMPASRDGAAVLLESLARQLHIRIASADDAVEVARAIPARTQNEARRAVAEVCRSANDWIEQAKRFD